MIRRIHGKGRARVAAAVIIIAAVSISSLAPGCDTQTPANLPLNLKPTAALVSRSDCKSSAERAGSEAADAAQDCFNYRLVEGNTLLVGHVNAAFNCCPGDISADISIANDTITIVERESESACRCLCLYDLEYRFESLEAGTYTIRFIEPYATDADDPLCATIDLSAAPSGTVCVERTSYPWSPGGAAEPEGSLVSRTDCLGAALAAGEETAPGDLSCAAWTYGSDGVLSLVHVNAAFNCCPGDIAADVRIRNDTITIVEREEQSICDCSCLYTLRFEIRNLEPRPYTIQFVEPYVQQGDERLAFTVDLSVLPAGMVCAYRPHYPWTYQSTMDEDRATLEAMREKIVELIGVPSCGGDGECRTIGLGVKPCGGVWEYLVYSTANIDRIELLRLVSRYNAFNYGFNRRYDIVSDCMLVVPRPVGCVEGVCAAVDEAP